MQKIKIVRKPTRQFSGNFKGNTVPEMLGSHNFASQGTEPSVSVKKALTDIPEHLANVEAEGGETVMFPTTGAFPGFPAFYDIIGKRHTNGGVNLALPDDAFIYSDTKDMKIKDKAILAMFGKSVGKKGKKQFTPAELSDKYDINEYLKVLADPDSGKIERSTAEQMIKNYQMKLGQLALVQESTKGFPDGIPAVAMPYMYSVGIDPKAILGDTESMLPPPRGKAQYGGTQENMSVDTSQLPNLNIINNDFQMQDRSVMKQTANLGKMQGGGPVVDWIENENDLALAIAKAQKENPGKPVYVKKDGKYQTVEGNAYPGKTYTGKQDFGKAKKSYEQLTYLLENNPDIQDSVYQNYINHIKDSKNKRLTQSTRERLLSVPKEDVIKNFLDYQEQVYTFDANGVDLSDPKDEYDTERNGKNGKYKALVQQFGLPQLSDDQIMMGQAFYKGFWDTKQDPKYKDTLSHISMGQFGKKDEPKNYKDDISPVDGIFGNTTAGQYVSAAGDFSLKGQEEEKKKDEVKDYNIPDTQYETQTATPDWWQQDVNNVGLALKNQLGLKKYYPKMQTVNLQEPNPVFKSPEREAAAIAEQANIASNANATFSDAQATSSRNSQVQGTAAAQIANALGQTHNYNIGIANQFEQLRNGIRNQEEIANANNAAHFYDQTVMTNQQFDNSKRQAEAVTLGAFNQGLTNAQKTAALNLMYPHFQTNAPTGTVFFNKGSKLDPSKANNNPSGLDSYLQKMHELGLDPDADTVGKFYTGFDDQSNQDILDMYGTGNVGYPGNWQKFGGSMKKVRIKKLPK
jgi:hypothetical protein